MAKHSITAVFDTRALADDAIAQLKSSGIPQSDITVLPAAGETGTYADEAEGRTRGFWASLEQLFGGTEDHATYAESIRRGGVMVAVGADDAQLDHVVVVLEQHGSVDLDEREADWRKEGWTGDSSVSGARTTSSSSAMAGSRDLAPDDPGMTAMGGAAASRTGTAGLGTLGASTTDGGASSTPTSAAYYDPADRGAMSEPGTMSGAPGFGSLGTRDTSEGGTTGAHSGIGTLGAGALGAAAGALGTAATEKRDTMEARPRETTVAATEPSTVVADRAVGDRATVPGSTGGIVGRIRDAADDVIQVVEERLNVGKRAVSRGKERVHTSVVPREVSEDVTLHDEIVRVDRRTVDRPVTAAAFDVDPFKERTIELEETTEEAVVGKTVHVVEEIGLRREGADRTETVHDTVRSTRVDTDDDRNDGRVGGAASRFAQQIRDDMEVIGSDGAHVGTVDHLDGGRIKLKKDDPASDGQHHYLAHDMVESVGDKVKLAMTAAEAKTRWAAA